MTMKNLMRYLAFVLMVGCVYAQNNLPISVPKSNLKQCPSNTEAHWTNCYGVYIAANGDTYEGNFHLNKLLGLGSLIYASGKKYVGEFKDGVPFGQGLVLDKNGAVLESGEWIAGTKKIDPSQMPRDASVNSNLPSCPDTHASRWTNCYGTYFYSTGGKLNGQKYVGEFQNGEPNGKGAYSFPNGKITVGEFKNGLPNGQGITTMDGTKFIGNFIDGKFDGQGEIVFKNGGKYVGGFKNGERNGLGIQYSADGSIRNQGVWANDDFVRTAPVEQPAVVNAEIQRLRLEAEEAKRKQAEAEEQLRLAQQQPQTTTATPTATTPSIGKRVALVVGNANYKIRPLKNPRNDADDISRSLRSSGFDVIDLRDASLQQMRNGVRQFGDRLINNDVGLVYYSGHGVEVKGRNYFIPVNADIMREDEIADQGLDVSLILEKMNTAGKGVNILIVDACRDDPFGRSFRSSSRGLAQMDAPRGTIIAYATSPGKVASDGDPRERNSPYTKNLVKAMQQPNKPIEQVFKEVRRAVQDETKNQQTPWENTSLSGDFYFRVQK